MDSIDGPKRSLKKEVIMESQFPGFFISKTLILWKLHRRNPVHSGESDESLKSFSVGRWTSSFLERMKKQTFPEEYLFYSSFIRELPSPSFGSDDSGDPLWTWISTTPVAGELEESIQKLISPSLLLEGTHLTRKWHTP